MTDTQPISTFDERQSAIEDLRAGRCPDGGGPHCVCRLLNQQAACVSLRVFDEPERQRVWSEATSGQNGADHE